MKNRSLAAIDAAINENQAMITDAEAKLKALRELHSDLKAERLLAEAKYITELVEKKKATKAEPKG